MPTLHLSALHSVKTSTLVRLCEHLKSGSKPIATKSRRYSRAGKTTTLSNLIQPSNSRWLTQPLVVTQKKHKRRMVIDYSQTVNKHTLLDAYPLHA